MAFTSVRREAGRVLVFSSGRLFDIHKGIQCNFPSGFLSVKLWVDICLQLTKSILVDHFSWKEKTNQRYNSAINSQSET